MDSLENITRAQQEFENKEHMENEMVLGSAKIKPMNSFLSPEELYDELVKTIKKYHPRCPINVPLSDIH